MSDVHKTIASNTLPARIAPDAPCIPATPIAFCLHFLGFYRWPLMAMLLLEAGQAACTIMLPYAIKEITDAVQLAQVSGFSIWNHVAGPLWLFVMLNLGILLFSRASGTVLVIIAPRLRRKVRHDVFGYLQHHSQRYFMENFAGSLATRITEVSMSVNHALWTLLFDFWPLIITFAVGAVLLFGVDPMVAGILLGWVAVYVGMSLYLAKNARKYAREFAAARSKTTGKIVDAVTNIQNAKLFARRSFERDYLYETMTEELGTAMRQFWFMEKMRWFQFSAALVLMVGLMIGTIHAFGNGGVTLGAFALAGSLGLVIINGARGLSRSFLEFFEYVGNINDGVNIIMRPHEVTDAPGARPLKLNKGEITVTNLTFGYQADTPIFNTLNLHIPAGQKVGLVGFSGSGKSTFVNLLLRLFDIQDGAITIDGQNIAHVTQDSLRAGIAMIPQDPMLFHRTLLENIRYGNLDATDKEVITAAKKAHAHDFIMQTAQQYQSLVGERGIKLSGGQRQRIAIARAILKNAPILLLDEATSALDSVTEKDIQNSLQTLMKNKTVVVIAHRLSTIAHLDRILVFHNGAIIEDGSHAELLKKQDGHYARMWTMQAGGFLPDSDKTETTDAPTEAAA